MLAKIVLVVGMAYLIVCAALFLGQRQMLYFPDTATVSPDRADRLGLRHWPSMERFHGFIASREPREARGTIVVFHGNAGAAIDRLYYLDALERQHFRVLLAEYPGYGGREGQPAEDTLVQDALTVLQLAYAQFGAPLYVWGESLGCGVAAAAVGQTETPVAGLVLFLPWDSLANVAASHYPWVPVRWLLRDRYDSVVNLRHYRGPVAVLLAGEDEVIPVNHGQQLYARLDGVKKLWVMPGASHNTMPVEANQGWWHEVAAFLRGAKSAL
ncbi:MAG: lysophospholipase [Desulfobulbus sp.]|jgi:alpha-beta hydrolase superfamily lysophospholipase|uniref:alpha/beta hydrolase n=1 Tax=Desulfobulbus sp. TaxID=895 RepID=UPI0028409FAA|nr:alpha/beta fold hydrolase [Desulfobulbus sp.]MDR2549759.1 lysophospholipase [Desulfobulbus sp.]